MEPHRNEESNSANFAISSQRRHQTQFQQVQQSNYGNVDPSGRYGGTQEDQGGRDYRMNSRQTQQFPYPHLQLPTIPPGQQWANINASSSQGQGGSPSLLVAARDQYQSNNRNYSQQIQNQAHPHTPNPSFFSTNNIQSSGGCTQIGLYGPTVVPNYNLNSVSPTNRPVHHDPMPADMDNFGAHSRTALSNTTNASVSEVASVSLNMTETAVVPNPEHEIITGIVTQTHNTFGMISGEIFFHISDVVGTPVQVNDKVVVEAQQMTGMPFKFYGKRVQLLSRDLLSQTGKNQAIAKSFQPINQFEDLDCQNQEKIESQGINREYQQPHFDYMHILHPDPVQNIQNSSFQGPKSILKKVRPPPPILSKATWDQQGDQLIELCPEFNETVRNQINQRCKQRKLTSDSNRNNPAESSKSSPLGFRRSRSPTDVPIDIRSLSPRGRRSSRSPDRKSISHTHDYHERPSRKRSRSRSPVSRSKRQISRSPSRSSRSSGGSNRSNLRKCSRPTERSKSRSPFRSSYTKPRSRSPLELSPTSRRRSKSRSSVSSCRSGDQMSPNSDIAHPWPYRIAPVPSPTSSPRTFRSSPVPNSDSPPRSYRTVPVPSPDRSSRTYMVSPVPSSDSLPRPYRIAPVLNSKAETERIRRRRTPSPYGTDINTKVESSPSVNRPGSSYVSTLPRVSHQLKILKNTHRQLRKSRPESTAVISVQKLTKPSSQIPSNKVVNVDQLKTLEATGGLSASLDMLDSISNSSDSEEEDTKVDVDQSIQLKVDKFEQTGRCDFSGLDAISDSEEEAAPIDAIQSKYLNVLKLEEPGGYALSASSDRLDLISDSSDPEEEATQPIDVDQSHNLKVVESEPTDQCALSASSDRLDLISNSSDLEEEATQSINVDQPQKCQVMKSKPTDRCALLKSSNILDSISDSSDVEEEATQSIDVDQSMDLKVSISEQTGECALSGTSNRLDSISDSSDLEGEATPNNVDQSVHFIIEATVSLIPPQDPTVSKNPLIDAAGSLLKVPTVPVDSQDQPAVLLKPVKPEPVQVNPPPEDTVPVNLNSLVEPKVDENILNEVVKVETSHIEAAVSLSPLLEAEVDVKPIIEAAVVEPTRIEAAVSLNPLLETEVYVRPIIEAAIVEPPHIEDAVIHNPATVVIDTKLRNYLSKKRRKENVKQKNLELIAQGLPPITRRHAKLSTRSPPTLNRQPSMSKGPTTRSKVNPIIPKSDHSDH